MGKRHRSRSGLSEAFADWHKSSQGRVVCKIGPACYACRWPYHHSVDDVANGGDRLVGGNEAVRATTRTKTSFDWDALVAELVRRVHVDGIPASASDLGLATDLVKWCGEQNSTEIPEIETVRKKIAVWLSRYRQEN